MGCMHLSNTYRLIKDEGYSGVLVEGDPARHAELCQNIPQEDVHKICQFITFEGETTLDKTLGRTPIPSDFVFLSIDIDGCDYYILESLVAFKPKVICIEHNPSMPNDVDFVQPKDFGVKQGSSPKAFCRLAKEKGYDLVAVTLTNLFFVRSDLKESVLGPQTPTLADLRDDSDVKCLVFVGFDGTLLSNQENLRFFWHGMSVPIKDMQVLPRVLRQFESDYSPLRRSCFRIWNQFRKLCSSLRR